MQSHSRQLRDYKILMMNIYIYIFFFRRRSLHSAISVWSLAMKIAYEKCADFQWVQWDQCCLILAWLLFPFNRFEIHFQPHWSLIKVKGIISGLYYIFHHSVPLTHRHQWQWICDHRHSIFTSPMRHNHNKNQGAFNSAMHLDLHYIRIVIIRWRMRCILTYSTECCPLEMNDYTLLLINRSF